MPLRIRRRRSGQIIPRGRYLDAYDGSAVFGHRSGEKGAGASGVGWKRKRAYQNERC